MIDTPEDMKWLAETHIPGADAYVCASITGNEDCPDMVCLYPVNDVRYWPAIYLRNKAGDLQKVQDASPQV